MKAYSKDLRLKVLAAVDRGMPRAAVVEAFSVSTATVKRWLRKRRETGDVDPEPVPGPSPRKREALLAALPAQAKSNPDLTLQEHRELFEEAPRDGGLDGHRQPCLLAPRSAAQKKSLPASERDEQARKGWREGVGRFDPRLLVFVDECGTHTSMTRLRARAPRGERVYGRVPRNRGRNTTLIASMTHEGMGPSMAVVGSTTKAVFETYVERVLAPSLSPGQVVVLDNLGAHKGERVRELVEARGCELLFLPAYSPDFSPIEEAFSKLKALLRKAAARTRGLLVEAIGRALLAVTARDAMGWFVHCSYEVGAHHP